MLEANRYALRPDAGKLNLTGSLEHRFGTRDARFTDVPRDIRRVLPGTLFEITTRCIGNKKLMVPTPEVTQAILGVIGFALHLFPGIQLHGFIFLSNHYHLLLTANDPETLSRFMCFLNGNLARKISALIGHEGPFWQRRFADIPVVDDQAQLDRLLYLFENGVKEGLVASPVQWVGATSARALAFGEELVGTWIDGTGLAKARKRGMEPDVADFTHRFTIHLSPLPCLRDKTPEERTALYRKLIRDVEEKYAGETFMGVKRVLAENRFEAPAESDRSPEPKCHASNLEIWQRHVQARQKARQEHRLLSIRIRRGEAAVTDLDPSFHPPPLHWDPRRNVRAAADAIVTSRSLETVAS